MEADVDEREKRADRDHNQVERLADPEDRIATEQNVPDRAATDGGHRRDDQNTHEVEALAAGRECSGGREERDADQREDGEEGQGMDLNSSRRNCAHLGASRFNSSKKFCTTAISSAGISGVRTITK